MGPLTEEEMAIELFKLFERFVIATERIATTLEPQVNIEIDKTIGPSCNI